MWFLTRVCCFLPLLHLLPPKPWDWADEFISKALPVKLSLRTQRSVCVLVWLVVRYKKLKWPDILIPLALARRHKKNTQHPVSALWLCSPKTATAMFLASHALLELCHFPSRSRICFSSPRTMQPWEPPRMWWK